jgi:hypothetical protein
VIASISRFNNTPDVMEYSPALPLDAKMHFGSEHDGVINEKLLQIETQSVIEASCWGQYSPPHRK